jgi:hypothetical protein
VSKLGSFNAFADATEPVSPAAGEEKPAAEPKPARQARQERKPAAAPPPAEMDKDEAARWRWQLGATARKLAAAQQRADEAARAWASVVADARHAGVPERLLLAAAADADVDLPAAT